MKTDYTVVSYFPQTQPGNFKPFVEEDSDEFKSIYKKIFESPGDADGIVWLQDDKTEEKTAVFILNCDHIKITEHLKNWADGNPESSFDLVYRSFEGGEVFCVALLPNFEAMRLRACVIHQLMTGFSIPNDAGVSFLFKPISCFINLKTFNMWEMEGQKISVGFTSRECFEVYKANNEIESLNILQIGKFPLIQDPDSGPLSQMITKNA